jgi:uncharacterized protein HemY
VKDDPAAARAYLDRFLAAAPENPAALGLLARVHIHTGAWKDALATFSRLERTDHRSLPEYHLLAGSVYELLREPQRAVVEYRQFLREHPQAPDAALANSAISELQVLAARK